MTTPPTPAAPDLAAEPGSSAIAFVCEKETEATVRAEFAALGMSDARVTHGDIDQAIEVLGRERSPRLLIVDVSSEQEPASKFARLAEFCDPSTTVIAVGDRNDVALYRNLKELGVAEYFYKPLVPELLAHACASVSGTIPDAASLHVGRLVTVLGVRGGVGTTTIAVNAAWHLAEALKRRVVLLDLDLQGGDAAMLLNAEPHRALSEALKSPHRLDDLFVERAVTRLSDRLDLLASLGPVGDAAMPDEGAVLALIARLQQRYRYVVVDLPFWAAARFPRVMHLPATVLLVTDQTLVSARDVLRWKAQLGGEPIRVSPVVLVNKAHAPGALTDEEFAAALGESPEIAVPFQPQIAEAGNLGLPAIAKSGPFRRGLAPLFQRLAGEPTQPRISLLHRVFG